ncbi:MAG: YdaU family protein [Caldilineaceae bacterium]
MNYFEMHIGDYEAATAHLSMLEDAAYGRMLRIYYRTEKPLPADLKQVCRLVRAHSKPERDAVQAVLDEFFEQHEDGWHQARCDSELARFRESAPEREAKKANEETRLARHRQERAALFKVLNDAGVHAPWNIKMEALRGAVEALQESKTATASASPATAPATAPATPATATHGNVPPLPTPHFPLPTSQSLAIGTGSAPFGTDPPTPPPSAASHPGAQLLALPPHAASAGPPSPQPPPFDGLNSEAINGKSVVPLAVNFELPESWGNDALALGWKADEALREAEKFRQYWVAGKGHGTRRSVRGWRQTWSTWLDKAARGKM